MTIVHRDNSARPKVSRMEKQVRNQSRGLFWLSLVLLLVCMAMTGMYGWGLGTDHANGALYAAGNAGADVGGSIIMAFCGTCFALRQRGVGAVAFGVACVCFFISLSAIIGFQASNREAQAVGRERAIALSDKFLEWTRETTAAAVAKEGGKGKPTQIYAAGVKEVGDAVNGQIRQLQSGEIIAVGDGQALTIARMFGVKEADARSWQISGFAGALLLIQYAALWFYGFARQRLEPEVARMRAANLGQFTGKSPSKAAMSDEDARVELEELLATGYRIDNVSFLARRFGWTHHRTTRWLRRQPDLDVPPPGRRGVRKSIAAHASMNGRGHMQ